MTLIGVNAPKEHQIYISYLVYRLNTSFCRGNKDNWDKIAIPELSFKKETDEHKVPDITVFSKNNLVVVFEIEKEIIDSKNILNEKKESKCKSYFKNSSIQECFLFDYKNNKLAKIIKDDILINNYESDVLNIKNLKPYFQPSYKLKE